MAWIFNYGEARVRYEPVPRRLCRPYGVCAKPYALPPLHRAGWAVSTVEKYMRSCATGMTIILNGMPCNTSSRRRGGTSINGSFQLSMKSVGPNASLVGDEPERAMPKLKAERDGGDQSCWPGLGEEPHRTWPYRRVSNLPPPCRAWPRFASHQATLLAVASTTLPAIPSPNKDRQRGQRAILAPDETVCHKGQFPE